MAATREQIIERIKKLQAHSVENGATEAEAVTFALKAQKLIADNNVEDWELGDSIKQEVIELETEKSYSRAWRGILAVTVASNFRCKAVINRKKNGSSKRAKTHILFIGYECDANAAALVFDHLYTVGDKLGKVHENRFYTDEYAYDNFVKGFVLGVKDELEKQCQALMLVCPKEVNDHMAGMSLTRGRGMRRSRANHESQEAGKAAGRDAVRSRRVESGKPQHQLAGA